MGESSSDPLSPPDAIQVLAHSTRDELISLKLTVASKRIIVALCENDRGRFVKLNDVRARINIPAEGIPQMRDALAALEAALESRDDEAPSEAPSAEEAESASTTINGANDESSAAPAQPSTLSSQPPHGDESKSTLVSAQRFVSDGRKFYFDILDNQRGRFFKISQSYTRRITMLLPVQALPLLRQAIDQLLEKAPPDTTVTDPSSVQRLTRTVERVTPMTDGSSVTVNVVQREIRVMGKRVVFESGANRRGSYIKIMEMNGPQRMTVMLPHMAVPQIIELLQEAVDAGDPSDSINPVNQNGQS